MHIMINFKSLKPQNLGFWEVLLPQLSQKWHFFFFNFIAIYISVFLQRFILDKLFQSALLRVSQPSAAISLYPSSKQ